LIPLSPFASFSIVISPYIGSTGVYQMVRGKRGKRGKRREKREKREKREEKV
jgi:hypothetical protein